MALKLVPTSQFKKDYKKAKKRGFDMSELQAVLDRLCAEEPLDNPEENPKGKTNHKPAIARTPIKELLPHNGGSG